MSQSYITIHYLNTIHTDHVWNTGANLSDRNYSRYAWKQNCRRTNADPVSAHNEVRLSLIKWKYNTFFCLRSELVFVSSIPSWWQTRMWTIYSHYQSRAGCILWILKTKASLLYFTWLYYLLLWTTVYERRWVNILVHTNQWPSDQLIKITVKQMIYFRFAVGLFALIMSIFKFPAFRICIECGLTY